MKFKAVITMALLVGALAVCPVFGATDVEPQGTATSTQGAPNSGDGISDGSGWEWDDRGAPNSGDGIPDGSGWVREDCGAPNSGDGIPDGSGWTAGTPDDYLVLLPLILIAR